MQLHEAMKLATSYGKTLSFKHGCLYLEYVGQEFDGQESEQLFEAQIAEMESEDFIQFYLL